MTQSKYDVQADILYLIAESGALARSVEIAPGVTIEYGESGQVIGVEILRASRILAEPVVASLHAKQAGVL
ncbi:MAG TPA: DUF2283 domain-containing protein [Phycisphaerae bacterium]|nr:DUF2283 domain-containing protein [Phycisphaerae bacterium]